MEETLLLQGGTDAPAVIEKVGQAGAGLNGRWVAKRMRRTMVTYFLALRRAFHQCRTAGVAIDGSSVGGQDTTSGLILARKSPEGAWRAGWMAPQVPSQP